jgi:hypothetical protein
MLVMGLLFTLGCGSAEPLGQVSGKVTFQGEPVGEGTVLFSNPDLGVSAEAELSADGSYTLTTYKGGLPPGDYKVTVSPPEIPDPSPSGDTEPGMITKPVDNIPEKYRSLDTTPLTVSVQEGTRQFDLLLEE